MTAQLDEHVRSLVAEAQRILVLTGAGISTASGIPDFRGPDGVWTRDPQAEALTDFASWRRDPAVRAASWQRLLESGALAAEPNVAHRCLVSLEHRGQLLLVATQNIDGLHLRAGHAPEYVVELHGSDDRTACVSCRTVVPTAEVLARFVAGESDPRCRRERRRRDASTSCGGLLKRTTVLFGESLPRAAHDRAVAAARSCDLLLVVGTSLTVQPAAGLVPLVAYRGNPIVIVNAEPTDGDRYATYLVRAKAETALPALIDTEKEHA